MKYVTMRAIHADPGMEQDHAVYLEDTGEWCAEDQDQADSILAAFPGAKVRIGA